MQAIKKKKGNEKKKCYLCANSAIPRVEERGAQGPKEPQNGKLTGRVTNKTRACTRRDTMLSRFRLIAIALLVLACNALYTLPCILCTSLSSAQFATCTNLQTCRDTFVYYCGILKAKVLLYTLWYTRYTYGKILLTISAMISLSRSWPTMPLDFHQH